jgi:hypothetical protein
MTFIRVILGKLALLPSQIQQDMWQRLDQSGLRNFVTCHAWAPDLRAKREKILQGCHSAPL